jgi:cell division topological specificity factor
MNFNSLFKKLIGKPASKDVAKQRLKFALLTDKLDVKKEMLKDLQKDLIEVISRYFEIDKESITIDIQRSEECSALVFNSPIISASHQRGGKRHKGVAA